MTVNPGAGRSSRAANRPRANVTQMMVSPISATVIHVSLCCALAIQATRVQAYSRIVRAQFHAYLMPAP